MVRPGSYQGRLATLGGEHDGTGGDRWLGTLSEDGWWTKVQVTTVATADSDGAAGEEATYHQSRGSGRKVEYRDAKAGSSEVTSLAISTVGDEAAVPPAGKRAKF